MNKTVFRVVIDTDNAAFEDAHGHEVARILHEIADGVDSVEWRPPAGGVFHDINGNTVGSWSWLSEDVES